MSLLNKMSRLFDSHVETNDNHDDSRLRTHYYRSTKEKLFKGCQKLIDAEPDMTLISDSLERGELSARLSGKRSGLLVVTIVSVRAFHTAVDFSISVDKSFNFNYGEKRIEQIYKKIDSDFPVVKTNSGH